MRLSTMHPQSQEYLIELDNFTKFWQKNQLFYARLPHSINAIASKMADDKRGQLLEEIIHNLFYFLQYQGKITPSEFVNPDYFLHMLLAQ